jgi:arylsulfatase A-like enzyme
VGYAAPFAGGPTALGFDRFFGLAGSLDMVPYTFLRGDRAEVLPTEDRDFPMTVGKPARTRRGPAAPGFEARDVLPALAAEATKFIADAAGRPFFLYLPLASPHTPVEPTAEWAGKSGISPYADFVMATDAAVGAVLAELDRRGVADNTLVIFTSDNGCSPQADLPGLRAAGHDPCLGFRGAKADVYEGGHRVPFIVRWPGVVTPGVTDQLACLTDVFRTCAAAAGADVPANAGEDSVDLAAVWRENRPARTRVVHHSVNGSFAIRDGSWKLCLCPGSGGWSAPRPGQDAATGLPAVQLFDLAADPAERTNRAADHPDRVAALTALLERTVAASPNAVPVQLRKPHPAPKKK